MHLDTTYNSGILIIQLESDLSVGSGWEWNF